MNNGKRLDQLTKEELIKKVEKGREYYLKLTKSVETLTDENATLIREKETFTESIAERDKQIEVLSRGLTAAYDLIPTALVEEDAEKKGEGLVPA